MTEGGAVIQPGAEEIAVPFRPRSAYSGYKAFGSADGAVLVEPRLAHELRKAAELATAERRFTGGLLYGRGWVDDQGAYLVVSGFIEAGPGENSGDRISADDPAGYQGDFTLSEADLRLLREDAARMYPASVEAGWWRTLAALGEFGPGDFDAQAALVGPDGVGLLVYGSGIHWGTAYLGPNGHAPDSAGTLVTAGGRRDEAVVPAGAPGFADGTGFAAGPAGAGAAGFTTEEVVEAEPAPLPDPGPHVIDLAAGESLLNDGPPPAPEELRPEDVPPESWVGPGGYAPEDLVPADDLDRPAPGAPSGYAAAPGRAAEQEHTPPQHTATQHTAPQGAGHASGMSGRPPTTRPFEAVPPEHVPPGRVPGGEVLAATTVRPDGTAGTRRTRIPRRAAPADGRPRPSVTARVRVPPRARAWAYRRPASPGPGESVLPTDVLLVVFALMAVIIAAAIIIGVLVSSVIVGVIIGAVGLLVVFSTVWMSRR